MDAIHTYTLQERACVVGRCCFRGSWARSASTNTKAMMDSSTSSRWCMLYVTSSPCIHCSSSRCACVCLLHALEIPHIPFVYIFALFECVLIWLRCVFSFVWLMRAMRKILSLSPVSSPTITRRLVPASWPTWFGSTRTVQFATRRPLSFWLSTSGCIAIYLPSEMIALMMKGMRIQSQKKIVILMAIDWGQWHEAQIYSSLLVLLLLVRLVLNFSLGSRGPWLLSQAD